MGPGHSKTLYGVVKTDSLNGLPDCATVDYATLEAQGRVHKSKYGLTKVLVGDEPLTAKSLTVMAHAFSDAARAAIEQNGGTCVVLPKTAPAPATDEEPSRAGSPDGSELTEENMEIVDEVEGADLVEELVESEDEAGSRAGNPVMTAAVDTASLLTALRSSSNQVGRTSPPVMSAAVDDVMEKLKSMTLLEASELVKAIEETFDVDASVGGGMMMAAPMAGPAAGGDAAAEPTEFDLVLDSFPADKKIAVLKIVRELTGLGLEELELELEEELLAARDTATLLDALRGPAPASVMRTGSPMMSADVDEVMEKLKSMTLLEASELVKAIEETFDVDASVGG